MLKLHFHFQENKGLWLMAFFNDFSVASTSADSTSFVLIILTFTQLINETIWFGPIQSTARSVLYIITFIYHCYLHHNKEDVLNKILKFDSSSPILSIKQDLKTDIILQYPKKSFTVQVKFCEITLSEFGRKRAKEGG